jgi:soluble lytic murein transglycosylase-like protein
LLHSEIKNKTLPDGTVQYYNTNEGKNPKRKASFNSPHIALIDTVAGREGLDPYLVKCIIKVESNFNADAVSVAGAMGLMQIMQDVARYYNVKNPFDPEENLNAGIKHFKSLLKYFQNDIPLSLAAYHAGLGRVKKNMKVPPIQSTVDYVNTVMSLYSGEKENNLEKVKKLYKRINSEGVIEIYNK